MTGFNLIHVHGDMKRITPPGFHAPRALMKSEKKRDTRRIPGGMISRTAFLLVFHFHVLSVFSITSVF